MAVSTSTRALPKLNMFISLEAEEDSSSDEDILAGELEDIDNDVDDGLSSQQAEARSLRRDFYDEEYEQWLQDLLDRCRMPATRNPPVFHVQSERRGLLPEDWDLWRVKCVLGEEEFVVVTLFANAKPELPIRSVFLPPIARRWVYLEATMSAELQDILRSIRGVIQIRGSGALELLPVPREEWIATLRWNRKVIESTVGTWVRLTLGKLKGAVGVVSGSYTWGVTVVVIPRIHHNPDSYVITDNNKKRKQSPALPPLCLFDVAGIQVKYGQSSVKRHWRLRNTRFFRKEQYHYDLLVVDRALTGVAVARTISSEMAGLFLQSRHPLLAVAKKTMPRPEEWHFYDNEEVCVLSSQAEGKIWETTANTVEVEYSDQSGLHTVSYTDVRKIFRVGDYVEVQEGLYAGRSGWVQYVEYVGEPSVDILEQTYCKDKGLQINIVFTLI
ncbi:hypothetical protein EDD85DRAFT_112381 [Armillaria nabsnona]|nr:hypothetical protein EDD85DRAFT_112381 [Armillaria nabsnona]